MEHLAHLDAHTVVTWSAGESPQLAHPVSGNSPLVFVGYLDVVNPEVGASSVNAIKARLGRATNDHVVHLSIGGSLYIQVDRGRVNQGKIVDGEVRNLAEERLARGPLAAENANAVLTFASFNMLGL